MLTKALPQYQLKYIIVKLQMIEIYALAWGWLLISKEVFPYIYLIIYSIMFGGLFSIFIFGVIGPLLETIKETYIV